MRRLLSTAFIAGGVILLASTASAEKPDEYSNEQVPSLSFDEVFGSDNDGASSAATPTTKRVEEPSGVSGSADSATSSDDGGGETEEPAFAEPKASDPASEDMQRAEPARDDGKSADESEAAAAKPEPTAAEIEAKTELKEQQRLNKPIKSAGKAIPGVPLGMEDGLDVTFSAVAVPGAEPFDDGVSYEVWGLDSPYTNQFLTKLESAQATKLKPGRYRIATRYLNAYDVEDVVIKPGQTHHVVNMNAGWISLRLIPHLRGDPLLKPTAWKVFTYGRDEDGNRLEVANVTGANPQLTLADGHYLVEARHEDAIVTHVVEVTAGQAFNYTINLSAGTVRASAKNASATGSGAPLIWEVFEAGEETTGTPLARNTAESPRFLLREGDYTLIASRGDWRGKQRVTVRPGREHEARVELRCHVAETAEAEETKTDSSGGAC